MYAEDKSAGANVNNLVNMAHGGSMRYERSFDALIYICSCGN